MPGLYFEARKYVVSKSSVYFSIICAFLFFSMALVGIFFTHTITDFSKIPAAIRSEASLGISYTSSILGFLVSGFALFFALIDKSDAKKLVYTPYPIKKTGLPEISCMRMTLYSFMYVFIHYMSFLLLCLIFSLFFPDGGPHRYITTYLYKEHENIMKLICLLFMCFSSGWFLYIVFLLKSFIWNLYQSILLSIAMGCMEGSPDNTEKKNS